MSEKVLQRKIAWPVLVASALFFAAPLLAQDGWKLEKDADGIKVYTRVVPNSPLREFRGEIQVPEAPEQVVAVLKDANAFKTWMPDVAISDLLQASEGDQYHYLENTVPWPLSNRDGVYHFTYLHTVENGSTITTVRVEATPDFRPRKKGKVRIPKSDGFWKLIANSLGTCVTYQIHADPGGAIPNWLVNSTVVDTPFKTLKGLRGHLQASPKR